MRRFLQFFVIATVTTVATIAWLHDGDLQQGFAPVLAQWDADTLARDAGLSRP